MKRAPRSLQHHVLYRKYNGQDSEISALLGKCGAKPVAKDWVGYWGEKDRFVSIKADGDRLAIDARLVFQGGGPVFSGAFKAKVAASGPMLEFAVDDKGRPVDPAKAGEGVCRVKLALVGPLLLVHDAGCVGAGSAVTFEGAYTKARR
ncbi:MAG: hypothetical protein H6872_04035 [Methylobacteriaceae bacterium]|nr:hypothetical protein [Methylobacteriaceae bacterium]